MSKSSNEKRPLLTNQRAAVVTLIISDAPRNRMSLEFMDLTTQEPTEP